MTKKKIGISDRFPNLSAFTRAIKEEIAYEDNISSNFKVKNFTSETNNNTDYGKYEPSDIVSETRDSIYYTEPIEELTQGGQAYISFYKVRKIVNKELENRLGPSINNKNEQ